MSVHHHRIDVRYTIEHHRLLFLLLALLLAAAVVFLIPASNISRFAPVGAPAAVNPAAAAEHARLEFRRGEWYAGTTARAVPAAALDQHERQANYASRAAAAESARLSFRQGEWNPAGDMAAAAEQARLEFRRGEWTGQ